MDKEGELADTACLSPEDVYMKAVKYALETDPSVDTHTYRIEE